MTIKVSPGDWERKIEDIRHRARVRLQQFEEAARRGNQAKAMLYLEQILALDDAQRITAEMAEISTQEGPSYVVGSWFLLDSYRFLMQGAPEWLHYVTGIRLGQTHTLERMVTFELDHQSTTYVSGDIESSREVLIAMDELGYALHAVFHSHRSRGADSTKPSSIDEGHQERLERGGYPAISAIFSEDGFIRFFALQRPFHVVVYGRGVEEIDEHLYHLTKINELP